MQSLVAVRLWCFWWYLPDGDKEDTEEDEIEEYIKEESLDDNLSVSRHDDDKEKYDFKISIDGVCYQNTHPDNYQVRDMTYW